MANFADRWDCCLGGLLDGCNKRQYGLVHVLRGIIHP